MSTRTALVSKDVNAPVATVRPLSKLPMPSKLRPPQVQVKRPLAQDEANIDGTGAPQAKRRKPEEVAKPNGRGNNGSTTAAKRPAPARSQRQTSAATLPKVDRPAVTRTKPAAARPAKPIVARNPPAKPTARPRANTSTKPSITTTSTANGPKKAKRPAWDLKGRLADIESQLEMRNALNHQLQQEVNERTGNNHSLESDNDSLRSALQQKGRCLEEANQTIQQLERKVRDSEDELMASTRRLQREKDDVLHANQQLDRQLADVRGDLGASRQECSGLKASVAQMAAAQAGITAELASTKLNYEQSLEAGRLLQNEIAQLKVVIAQHEAMIADQEAQIRENETTRRKLHNTIQELKGNIRVFCRVRPLLPEETASGHDMRHINFTETDNKTIELADANLNESNVGTRSSSSKKYEFGFDRVFDPSSTQAEVFDEISQLVQSALDGYNVCVFAYGQTGSGKTFTMEGPDDVGEETEGMIPRAVRQIFQTASELKEKGWEYTMEASFLEIYNETVRDLLGAGDKKCEIKLAAKDGRGGTNSGSNDVEVTNSTTVAVSGEAQVRALLGRASHQRAVAATGCNERSSRSHSVFRLRLTGTNALTGEASQGTLNLVDLAGSERLSQSGSTGERLRETKNINRSLSNLGNVIMALANKESHVPYRNSKLTHLLQNSLGGNSKTLMFVNISPREENLQESLCSLRFATKVNQCNIGTAQKKVK
ncbi:carboxy-terminal kinesin 2-like isoform X2 [Acanthaster planci]|uniref:Kinesin-like protein n=1 Tax=Acanthaster planci TaxID=133434 RepID=A0A8B7Y4X4_ACAPL|nr:carboxy-terminal kinesin 2-like isoform X2 [Acanthaster planci]